MRAFKWVYVVLFCGLLARTTVSAQEAPTLTRIGRGAVESVQWSPDGSFILVSTVAGAWLYTPDLQDLAYIPDAQLATLSPDGHLIAGTPDGTSIEVWDSRTFQPLKTIASGIGRVRSLLWSPDSHTIAVGGIENENVLATFDLESLNSSGDIWVYLTVSAMQWSPDGQYLAVYDANERLISVFPRGILRPAFTQSVEIGWPHHLLWSDSTHLLFLTIGTGDSNGAGILWDIATGETLFSGATCMAGDAALSPDNQFLYIGCSGAIGKFDPETVLKIGEIPAGAFFLLIAVNGDGTAIASTTMQYGDFAAAQISITDPQRDVLLQTTDAINGGVADLEWRPGANQLLFVSERGEIGIFDLTQNRRVAASAAHTTIGSVAVWSSDSIRIAAADTLESVNIWNAASGDLLNTLNGNNQPVTEIEWQPNGDLIATRGGDFWDNADPVIRVWNATLATDQALVHVLDLAKNVYPIGMEWSPDGQWLVSGGGAAWLSIWNVSDMDRPQEIQLLEGNSLTGNIRWSPDSTHIAAPFSSSGNGGAIFIYDLKTDEYTWDNAQNYQTVWVWTPANTLMWLFWDVYGCGGYAPAYIEPYLQVLGQPDSGRSLVGLTRLVSTAFLSPNGRYAAAIDNMGSGMVWDAATGAPVTMLADAAQVAWTPDETRFVVQRTDGRIWLFEADGMIQEELPLSASMQKPVGTFFWSPDSSKLAHLHDGVIDLWQWTR